MNNTNNKKFVRLTESDLHRIIKESVNKVLAEYTYTHEYFGMADNKGEFVSALFNAYKCASDSNKRKLMTAFPELFPEDAINDLYNHINWDSFKAAHPNFG